jgi:outer membrane protein assembly factor BamB
MRIGNGARVLRGVFFAMACSVACSDSDDPPAPQNGRDASEAGPSENTRDAAAGDAATPGEPSGNPSWTMMGGDHRNHYNNPVERELGVANAKDLKLKWSFEVGGFPPGSPLVVDGAVYVMATGGTYALDLDDGSQRWSRADIAGTASVAYADGFVYVHSSRAQLYKLNASDGTTVWGPVRSYELPTCDGTSSPVVARDKVLVGHSCGAAEVTGNADQDVARGGVDAFAIADGTRQWTYWTVPESGENGAMVWSTVGIDLEEGVVYATTGNNYTLLGENSDSIHAIDLETGARVWKHQVREGDVWSRGSKTFVAPTGPSIDTDFGANPIIADVNGRKLVAAGDKASAFWALDRATGEIVWSRDALSARHSPAYGGVLMNGAFDGKNFYAAVNDPPAEAHLYAFDALTGDNAVEPIRLGASVWGAPSLANGLLLVPVNREMRIYNAKTFELLVSFDTGGTIAAGAPVVVDGNVVVQSGLMYGFATDAFNNNKILCYALDGDGPSTEPEPNAPSYEPKWGAIYDEIIVASGCSGAALCHGGTMGLGGLSFISKEASYAALVNVEAMGTNLDDDMATPNCKDTDAVRVVPGKPDESLLLQKVSDTQTCGDSMPPGGKLNDRQIAQIRTWIQDGAKDN